MSHNRVRSKPEATVLKGAGRKDGGQDYVIKRGSDTRIVTATGASMRSIREIMSDRSDLMRKLADR